MSKALRAVTPFVFPIDFTDGLMGSCRRKRRTRIFCLPGSKTYRECLQILTSAALELRISCTRNLYLALGERARFSLKANRIWRVPRWISQVRGAIECGPTPKQSYDDIENWRIS